MTDRLWLIDWVCEFCGFGNRTVAPSVDHIQCPMCGDLVVPTAGDGRIRPVSAAEARQLQARQWPDPR